MGDAGSRLEVGERDQGISFPCHLCLVLQFWSQCYGCAVLLHITQLVWYLLSLDYISSEQLPLFALLWLQKTDLCRLYHLNTLAFCLPVGFSQWEEVLGDQGRVFLLRFLPLVLWLQLPSSIESSCRQPSSTIPVLLDSCNTISSPIGLGMK